MRQAFVPIGWAVFFSALALIVPVVMGRLEDGLWTFARGAVLGVAGSLLAVGVTLVWTGSRQSSPPLPAGVRIALAANIVFLAFFALELSDRIVRQEGRIGYWSTYLHLPTLALFGGLVAGRRWAWWTWRLVSALSVLWFVGFAVLVPFARLQSDGIPIPWYGRVYVMAVTLAFVAILTAAFRSLGRPETRNWFGLPIAAKVSKPTVA
ncbi:hypothetical protein [Planctomyces sp. SH-PL14]|uniref:hypothetical protein n=1 Tax=Planctomyces sp. SH-PL14 TaxID=1632864 RepID=UPI00078E921A|nr:hypothetical protein [Planctomyces sp. SH-PL14]AMV19944.1 hypothetical protein VT03_18750 [Planctomyces sp. SH-PL14]